MAFSSKRNCCCHLLDEIENNNRELLQHIIIPVCSVSFQPHEEWQRARDMLNQIMLHYGKIYNIY